MARFEREDTEDRHLPTSLGTVTEDLRSTIESEVAKIVARAEARAAEIEDQALEKAGGIERESERRAEEVFRDSRERLQQMISEIDAIDRVVGDAVRSLRAAAEGLSGQIEGARREPFTPIETIEPSDIIDPASSEPTAEEHLADAVSAEADGPAGPDLAAQPESQEPVAMDDPEVRDMIRQQLLSLAEGGRNRADAERMLLRFRQGEQYFDLLDEIYPEEAGGRRGLLRRRKPR
jgi:hypothetical protein